MLVQAAYGVRADPGIEQAAGGAHHVDKPVAGGRTGRWFGARAGFLIRSLCATLKSSSRRCDASGGGCGVCCRYRLMARRCVSTTIISTPFMTGEQTGLSRDLVKYLNEKRWRTQAGTLAGESGQTGAGDVGPGFDGLVAWVNPAWGGSPARALPLDLSHHARYQRAYLQRRQAGHLSRARFTEGMTFGGIEGIAIRASTRRRPGGIWCGSMPRRSKPTSACWCAVAST